MRKPSAYSRLEARSELASRGITGPAAEAFLDATASDRHAARVERFAIHALHEWCRIHKLDDIPPPRRDEAAAYAIAVICLDAFGPCSPSGPTPATERAHHRAFRNNCGARRGPKSGSTFAAARDAIALLWPHTQSLSILIVPSTHGDGIDFELGDGLMRAQLPLDHSPLSDAQPVAWLRTLVLEGMRRATGETPWFQLRNERVPQAHERRPSAHPFDHISIGGSATEWAFVLARIVERERIESSRPIAQEREGAA